jgi:hypothetical protein
LAAPGVGATQWRLIHELPCRFIKTVPRGQRYFDPGGKAKLLKFVARF